jgi:hypothetical protein
MSNSQQAPVGSGHPVGDPSRSERLVDVPGGFADESIEEGHSPFIRKVLDTDHPITSHDLNSWFKDPVNLLKDINLIIESYRDTTAKLAEYKKRYGDAKGIFENTKLQNARLEADVKRYTMLLDRFMLVPAAPVQAPEAAPEIDPRSRKGSPAPHAPYGAPRVVILPDPTLFYGDRTVFDDWLVQIKNKLRGNADMYPTEDLKIIYVSSRLAGDALALTNPRMNQESPHRYRQLSEIYDHLNELYSDPNKLQNARRDFGKLMLRPGHVFQEFYARFLRLSTEGNITEQLKWELNEKLPAKLQESVRVYYNDPSVDIVRFAQFCTTNDQQIRASYDKAKEYKKTMAGTTKPSSPYTPQQVVKEESTSTAIVKYEPPQKRKQRPMTGDPSTVKCFNCNEFGHYVYNCPHKRTAETKVALSQVEPGLFPPEAYGRGSDSEEEPENEYP